MSFQSNSSKECNCTGELSAAPTHSAIVDESAAQNEAETNGYLHGWRFAAVLVLSSIIFFIVQIEANIVVTALVAITADIGGFELASWVLSAYLLGFVSLVVVISKLSDIIGRKPVYIVCILVFTVFSGACAASRTMSQLIILRAFQGIGGGGSFAMAGIMIVQIVPPKDLAKTISYTGVTFVMAAVLGPVTGGGIAQHTTWRWIFLFNVPVGMFSLLLALISIPNGYPNHQAERQRIGGQPNKASELLHRVDLVGSTLLLLSTIAFTSGFLEINVRFAWNSAYFVCLIIASILLFAALLLWERRLEYSDSLQEPILPWRFIARREMIAALVGATLVGGTIGVTALQLPQRFQLVNGLSAVEAGVHLLPFGAASAVGGTINARIMDKFKVPLLFTIIFGAILQAVGFALLGTSVAKSNQVPHVLYAYEVVAGLGCGFTYIAFYCAIQYTAEKRDQAVGLGITNQLRAMGNALTVAITTSVFNGHVLSGLEKLGVKDPGTFIIEQGHGADLSPELRGRTRRILSDGYNREMLILCAFGAAQVLAALLMWKKKHIRAP